MIKALVVCIHYVLHVLCYLYIITVFTTQGYRPCAQRASILFFVMNDMGRIDPMYQFSLDAYIGLFSKSIEKSLKHPKLEDRIKFINDYHTLAVYR